MHFLYRAFGVVALIAGLVAIPGAALAAETASSDLVIIREDRVIEDDLYASGYRVIIEGLVEGDLIAFAGEEVVIEGEVTGSVYALAPYVSVSGTVGRSLRVTAQTLEVTGSVGKDVVFAGVGGEIGDQARIEGDLLAWAWDLTSAGQIGGDLTGTQGNLRLQGEVAGDVEVTVRQLTITGPFTVGGDFGYRSSTEASGLEEADVAGVVAQERPLPPNIRVRALGLLARLLIAIGLTVTSLLVAWAWPRQTEKAASAVRSYGRAYGWGALVIFSPLLLAAVAGVVVALAPASAGLPLLALLAPLILALLGIVMALSLVAGLPVLVELGRRLPGDFGLYGSLLLGAGVIGVIWLIPLVSWLVPLLVLPPGLGAWLLGLGGVKPKQELL